MKHGSKIRALALPVCWTRGHRPEGESIIDTRLPEVNYIKRCGRCGRYILHTHIGEMTLTEKAALQAKAKHDRAMAFPPIDMEASHV